MQTSKPNKIRNRDNEQVNTGYQQRLTKSTKINLWNNYTNAVIKWFKNRPGKSKQTFITFDVC